MGKEIYEVTLPIVYKSKVRHLAKLVTGREEYGSREEVESVVKKRRAEIADEVINILISEYIKVNF